MTFRPEVLDELARHGLRPGPDTSAARLREQINDLYRIEIRKLRDRCRAGEFAIQDLPKHVVELRRRYTLLSIPIEKWTGAVIRPCIEADAPVIDSIINEAARAYRGHVPDDCLHDPYMSRAELLHEMANGVRFSGWEEDGELLGVMGIQDVKDVSLIRHAYVRSAAQGKGIGSALLKHLTSSAARPLLVGTWADATWAIALYQRHGFELAKAEEKDRLLSTYWTISDRQRETSVVLVHRAQSR